MNEINARASFMSAVSKIYRGVSADSVQIVREPAFAVPGFFAFEVAASVPLRGWANDDVGVLARRQNFMPVLEALNFRDDELCPPINALVMRMLWIHGPPYTLAERIEAGELGATEAIDLTPKRATRRDGATEFSFALRDPGDDDEPECVFEYYIIGYYEDEYRIGTFQVAPAP